MVLQCLRTLRAVLDATPTSEFYIDLLDSHWTASFVPNASRHILHVASNSRFIGQGHGLFEPREQKIESRRSSRCDTRLEQVGTRLTKGRGGGVAKS